MKKELFGALTGFVNDDGSISIVVNGRPGKNDGVNAGVWLTEQLRNSQKPKPGNRYAGTWKESDSSFYIKFPSPKQEKIDEIVAAYAKWVEGIINKPDKSDDKDGKPDGKKSDKDGKKDGKPDGKKDDKDGKKDDKDGKKDDKDGKKDDKDGKKDTKSGKPDDKKSEVYPWEKSEDTWSSDFEKEFEAAFASVRK